MSPSVFCTALLKVYEYVAKPENLFFGTSDEIISYLKMLEYSTLIGSSNIPKQVKDFFDHRINDEQLKFIKELRDSEVISSLSLSEERYIYRSLIRVLSK